MKPRVCAPVLAIALVMTLAGCGYKGPLTLPPKPGEVTVRPGAAGAKPETATDTAQPTAPATPAPAGTTKPGEKPAKPAPDTSAPTPPGTSDATRG